MEYGVIMAGGSGTRLWPISREAMPKQLLPIVRGQSLLKLSFDRLRAFLPADRIFVCTNAAHRDVILEGLPELPKDNLLGEPVGRDTANAVGFGAAVLQAIDPDARFAIVTADHVIEPVDVFADALKTGFKIVEKDASKLVTFGIVPTTGHTGLGYVQRGEPIPGVERAFGVAAFKEKPDQATADAYVASGRYYWNSGMFVWRAATVMATLKEYLPKSYEGLTAIAKAWKTGERDATLKSVYPTLQKISVDYAIMEPAGQRGSVAVVEMPVKWLDVGSWPQLAETMTLDEQNNARDAGGRVVAVDSRDNIVFSNDAGHLVSLVGVRDLIVVHTPDATMVCPRGESQRVKELVAAVRKAHGDQHV